MEQEITALVMLEKMELEISKAQDTCVAHVNLSTSNVDVHNMLELIRRGVVASVQLINQDKTK